MTCLTKIDGGVDPAALEMEVLRSHGCICLKGPAIDSIVNAADSFLQTFCINDYLPSEDKPTPSDAAAHSAGVDTVSCGDFTFDCQTGSLQMRHAAAGSELDSRLQNFSSHVTLVTKEEVGACTISCQDLLLEFQNLDLTGLFPAGIAVATPVQASTICQAEQQHLLSRGKQACVSCVWNEANALRAKHGLPTKDLHISLGPGGTELDQHSLAALLPASPFQLNERKLLQVTPGSS